MLGPHCVLPSCIDSILPWEGKCGVIFIVTDCAHSFNQPNPQAQPNMNPIWHGKPSFISSTLNGKVN